MVIILPTSTDTPHYKFEIELDKADFHFAFDWNDRASHWYFSLSDASHTLLLASGRVVVGFPLLNRFRDPRLPAGMLDAIDTSGNDLDPGFADLGDRVKLLYTEAADIPADLVISV